MFHTRSMLENVAKSACLIAIVMAVCSSSMKTATAAKSKDTSLKSQKSKATAELKKEQAAREAQKSAWSAKYAKACALLKKGDYEDAKVLLTDLRKEKADIGLFSDLRLKSKLDEAQKGIDGRAAKAKEEKIAAEKAKKAALEREAKKKAESRKTVWRSEYARAQNFLKNGKNEEARSILMGLKKSDADIGLCSRWRITQALKKADRGIAAKKSAVADHAKAKKESTAVKHLAKTKADKESKAVAQKKAWAESYAKAQGLLKKGENEQARQILLDLQKENANVGMFSAWRISDSLKQADKGISKKKAAALKDKKDQSQTEAKVEKEKAAREAAAKKRAVAAKKEEWSKAYDKACSLMKEKKYADAKEILLKLKKYFIKMKTYLKLVLLV